MITAHEEKLSEIFDEITPLFPTHHEELALNQDIIDLDPDYGRYFKMEEEGTLVIFTIRELGVIVGYYVGFIVASIHNKKHLTCYTDIFFIHPDCRGMGAGNTLFDFSEQQLRKRGIARWLVTSKDHQDSGPFLTKKGFIPIETVHCKILV